MTKWKNFKIGEIAEIISGGTPKTSIAEYWNGDVYWLSVKDFNNDNKYVYNTEKKITQLGFERSATNLLQKGDIIISARGTVGEIAMIPYPMTFNQSCYGLRAKQELIDNNFLYYLLKNNIKILKNNTHGSVFDTITKDTLNDMAVLLPPLDVQRKIAGVLGALDDKIELNNKINNNLEQQAQALFKSWFVDFEPFGGKMPDDWKVGKLGDFIDIKRGGSPRPIQNYLTSTGLRWLKISDATAENSPYIMEIKECIKPEGLNKTVYLKSGALVLSNSATPGIPKFLNVDTCIHDGWLYFPHSKLSNEYLFLLFKYIRNDLLSLGNGSVFTNLKTDILRNFCTIFPSKEILEKFDEIVSQIFVLIKKNREEIAILSSIRDTLLPKLMKGEIEVDKVDISADKLSFNEG